MQEDSYDEYMTNKLMGLFLGTIDVIAQRPDSETAGIVEKMRDVLRLSVREIITHTRIKSTIGNMN